MPTGPATRSDLSDSAAGVRILVVGAGALGGYFGARLLAAGRDVTFLVRPERARTLREQGLRVSSPKGDLQLPAVPTVLAAELAGSAAEFGLVLLTCKSQDLDAAMADFAPGAGSQTAIVPLLNGMAHLAALDERFGRERVLGGGCVISATRAADGTIRHLNSLDRLFFGERDPGAGGSAGLRFDAVSAALSNAGFDADRRPDILKDMWQKWTFIAASAGITCLMRATIGDLVAAGGAPLALRLFDECVAIASAAGYAPAAAFVAQSQGYLTAAGSGFTASMLRDLEAGAPIEAQQIVGDLLARGQQYGLATPLLEVVNAHLRSYGQRRAREKAAAR